MDEQILADFHVVVTGFIAENAYRRSSRCKSNTNVPVLLKPRQSSPLTERETLIQLDMCRLQRPETHAATHERQFPAIRLSLVLLLTTVQLFLFLEHH
jgi:hypothetical protein